MLQSDGVTDDDPSDTPTAGRISDVSLLLCAAACWKVLENGVTYQDDDEASSQRVSSKWR